jgi:hypothetical protein
VYCCNSDDRDLLRKKAMELGKEKRKLAASTSTQPATHPSCRRGLSFVDETNITNGSSNGLPSASAALPQQPQKRVSDSDLEVKCRFNIKHLVVCLHLLLLTANRAESQSVSSGGERKVI